MGSGKPLSEHERGLIEGLKMSGLTDTAIAKQIKRSQCLVSSYLRNKENYGKNYKKCSRKPMMSSRDKRTFFRDLTNGMTINESKAKNKFKPSKQALWKLTRQQKNLKFMKMKSTPFLSDNNILARLEWSKKYMSFGLKWREVIFSDEKKFNLDGPDGYHYYWHDLRTEPKYFSKRAFGGGSVMVWAAIAYNGRSRIVFLEGRQNSETYRRVLERHLMPFIDQIDGQTYVFQQDNCRIHTSNAMKTWFTDQNLDLLDWPSFSPDMNIIENC